LKINLPPPAKQGEQAPRVLYLPSNYDLALSEQRAEEMIDLSAVAGLILEPWQEIAAEGMTLSRPDGKWSAFEVGIQANRQNGKGSIIEARQLAGLFIWGESLQLYTAHEFKTAQEMFTRIRMLIESTPTLDRMVSRIRTADGEEAIETKKGTRLKFMARSTSSGRGFTGDVVYLDEAFKLKQQVMAAILSTMSARSITGNPQLIYASSAGMADSEVQERVRARALAGNSDRLAYLEWSARPWDELTEAEQQHYESLAAKPGDGIEKYYDDPETARLANPAYGLRISDEFVQSEREALGSEEFARERLGIWARLGGEVVIPPEWWEKGRRKTVPEHSRIAFAVDVPPSRDSAVIAAALELPNGRIFVDLIEQDYGTEWVPERLAELRAKWSPVAVVVDAGSAAGALIPELKRQRVRHYPVNLRGIGAACGAFYDLLKQGKLEHAGHEQLDAAVAAAQRRPLGTDGSLWAWTRKNVVTDISPLVAATLALAGLQSRPKSSSTKGRAIVL
jgi:hypothetical protein